MRPMGPRVGARMGPIWGPIWGPYGLHMGPYGAHMGPHMGDFDRHGQTLTVPVDPPPSAALTVKGPNQGFSGSVAWRGVQRGS